MLGSMPACARWLSVDLHHTCKGKEQGAHAVPAAAEEGSP